MKGGQWGGEADDRYIPEYMFDGDENTFWHAADGVHAKGVIVVFNVSF